MQYAKMWKWSRKIAVVWILAMLCQGCATSSLTSSWSDESFNGPVGTVLVVGVFKDAIPHKLYENTFVDELGQAGVKGLASHNYGLGTTKPNKAVLENAVKESGADFVLITHLLTEQTSIKQGPPGHVVYGDVVVQDNMHNYYSYTYGRTWNGDIDVKKVDRMEASLFAVKSGKCIWAARSKSVDFQDLLRTDDEQLEMLFIKDMQQHKLF